MNKRRENDSDRENFLDRSAGERPMQVDYFAILSIVMAILLVLSQVFVLVWLDLL